MGLFRYSYKAEVEINADLKTVWDTLIRTDDYQEWNSFTPKVETNWEVGTTLNLTVRMDPKEKPIMQKEVLRKFKLYREIAWGVNWGIFLRAERIQHISERADGSVTYFTEDVIWGVLSPIVDAIYGKNIQRGFKDVARGLKAYCENGFG